MVAPTPKTKAAKMLCTRPLGLALMEVALVAPMELVAAAKMLCTLPLGLATSALLIGLSGFRLLE